MAETPASAPAPLERQTYLSVDDLLIYLRCQKRQQIYDWLRENPIPRCRMGRRLLFLRRDVDEIIQGGRRGLRLTRASA